MEEKLLIFIQRLKLSKMMFICWNQWDVYNSRDIKWSKYHSIAPVICLSMMRCKWSTHNYWEMLLRRCEMKIIPPLRNKRSSKDPDDQIETKTWLMENQVKLSCFRKCSSGDMTAVILTLTWSKSLQFWLWSISTITLNYQPETEGMRLWVNRQKPRSLCIKHDRAVL